MNKIIYLAGMPRSGTTFIQGCFLNEGCVCLGEVGQTINAIRNVTVKGILSPESHWNEEKYKELKFNQFWESISKNVLDARSQIEALEIVYDAAASKYPNAILIDSSKHIGHLKNLMATKFRNNITIIHMVRNHLSWRDSIEKYEKRLALKKDKFKKIRWIYVNIKLHLFIKKMNMNNRVCYYDEMVIKNDIDKFVQSEIDDSKKYDSQFLEMFGSKKNIDKIRKGEIFYDHRWIVDCSLTLFDAVSDRFMKYFQKKYRESL